MLAKMTNSEIEITMPEISRFYGIIIYMYLGDHVPPHFHAIYAEFEAQVNIETGEIVEGQMPRKQLRLVQAWCELHNEELMFNWSELHKQKPAFKKIIPLQ